MPITLIRAPLHGHLAGHGFRSAAPAPVLDFLMVALLFLRAGAIAAGRGRTIRRSRTSRFRRVVLGGLWATIIVARDGSPNLEGLALNFSRREERPPGCHDEIQTAVKPSDT